MQPLQVYCFIKIMAIVHFFVYEFVAKFYYLYMPTHMYMTLKNSAQFAELLDILKLKWGKGGNRYQTN